MATALLAKYGSFAIDINLLEIKERIASGAGGTAYKGEHGGKLCAIKKLHANFVASSVGKTLLQREVGLLVKVCVILLMRVVVCVGCVLIASPACSLNPLPAAAPTDPTPRVSPAVTT